VQIYDRGTGTSSVLANISSRGFIEADPNALIGGFIAGNQPGKTKVLVRAIGPSIKSQVPTAIDDPTLELHDSNGNTLAANDDWKDGQPAEVQKTGAAPKDDRESAIVMDMPPGTYTAIVRGSKGATGVGLVEIYNLR
jgi:hypothetical protein